MKTDWRDKAIALYQNTDLSQREIAKVLNVPKSTLSDYFRRGRGDNVYFGKQERPLKWDDFSENESEQDNSRILVISDMHIPYEHPNTLEFLKYLKNKYKPTRVICIGDEVDHHALSFHDSDPDLRSAGDEHKDTVAKIAKIHSLFPKMDLLDSNHGSLAYRKAKHHGIPRHYIKSYSDVLKVGPGWVWHDDLTVILPNGKPVFFHHGKSSNGLTFSQQMGMSVVQGHHHQEFAIRFWSNPLSLMWSMQVGCLIDDRSYAFAYNSVNIKRPIIGCGLIIDSEPKLEAMPL